MEYDYEYKTVREYSEESCPLCGGATTIWMKAGYDIWPGGEEDQHRQNCKECGAFRFICEGQTYPSVTDTEEDKDKKHGPYVSAGKWYPRSTTFF